jgi:hypothetical protein
MARPYDPRPQQLPQGTRVEVRTRSFGSWSRGFEIAGSDREGYRVRRLSDHVVLPVAFPAEDLRAAG